MSTLPLQINSRGLVLREWTDGDLAAMAGLFDDADIAYRTPFGSPFDLAAAQRYLQHKNGHAGERQRVHLAITTDGRTAMGEIVLNRATGGISYVVGAPYRGQRLATRAVQAMVEYAYQALALPR